MASGVPKVSTNTAVLKFDNYVKSNIVEKGMVVRLAQEALLKNSSEELCELLRSFGEPLPRHQARPLAESDAAGIPLIKIS